MLDGVFLDLGCFFICFMFFWCFFMCVTSGAVCFCIGKLCCCWVGVVCDVDVFCVVFFCCVLYWCFDVSDWICWLYVVRRFLFFGRFLVIGSAVFVGLGYLQGLFL